MGWFRRRKPTPQDQLLQQFLDLEASRLTHAAKMEEQRQTLELKRLQIEVENAETLQKAKAQADRDKEELRQKRAAATAIARDAKALKRVSGGPSAAGVARTPDGCRVCANPSDSSLTTADVSFHYSGHRGQTDLFKQ